MNNKLEFILSLVDRVSAPAAAVMKSLDRITRNAETGYRRIGYGIAGITGAGYGLVKVIEPAREMNRAIGDVRSLGVANDVLDKLRLTAKQFALDFGESASGFVTSAYDIQSAIAGLQGDELGVFTRASALLAKGTKADMSEMSAYLGQAYSVFQNTADAMGKSKWIEQFAAQSAMAVNIFRAEGKDLGDAFRGLGPKAVLENISMAEQFAVIGQLKNQMEGGEAGTRFRAMLDNMDKAAKKFGITVTDKNGGLLSIPIILDKIKKATGKLGTHDIASTLKDAFNSDEAAAAAGILLQNIDMLRGNIELIGKQKGIDQLITMANARTDKLDRIIHGWEGLREAVGQKMLKALDPTLDKIIAFEKDMLGWTEKFPKVTALVGELAMGVFGVAAGLGVLSIIVGVLKLAWVGLTAALLPLKAVFFVLKFAVASLIPWLWGLAAPLLANPITWIVLGITAAVYGLLWVVEQAIRNWDAWKAAIVGWASAMGEQSGLFGTIRTVLDGIGAGVDWLRAKFDALESWWHGFVDWLSNIDPLGAITRSVDRLFASLRSLPVVGSLLPSFSSPVVRDRVPAGGVGPRVGGAGGSNIGAVNVFNYGQPMSGSRLAAELAFQAP